MVLDWNPYSGNHPYGFIFFTSVNEMSHGLHHLLFLQNGVEDIFPLLRFIGPSVRPFNDYAGFQEKILKPMKSSQGKGAIIKIQALLKIILLRRSKESKDKAGNPILKLPGKELILLRTPFRTR